MVHSVALKHMAAVVHGRKGVKMAYHRNNRKRTKRRRIRYKKKR